MYDLIIIGAGPAGITAAVYASRKKINTLVITKDIGGQAAWSGEVENYTGYQFISGPELVKKFEEHLKQYDILLKENEEVKLVKKIENKIFVKTDKAEYFSKALIIASGKKSRELNVPGEKEFKNKGLSYCATCDGPLFSKKIVAVIGGGNSALDAALQLMRIARKVYIINNTAHLVGDPVMQEKVLGADNVEILNNTAVYEIFGDNFVKGIKVKTEEKEDILEVEGIFIEIGLIPNSDFIKEVAKNQYREIMIDRNNQTNIAGIFACGDVTDVVDKQIIVAAGEGAKAALSAFRYLMQYKD